VKLVGQPIQSLMIPKSSETGQLLLSLWEEYRDFPTRTHDDYQPQEIVEVDRELPGQKMAIRAVKEQLFL
jgi:hypothetical protein